MRPARTLACALAILAVGLAATRAAASETLPGSDLRGLEEPAAPQPADQAPPPPPSKPAPYSLPWGMRPALAASSVRSDTVVAFQDASRTSVTFLSASLKLLPDLALSARYGWVHDAPDAGAARSAFTNVGLAVLYAPKLDAAFRVPLSGGVVLPVAQGGGGAPDPDAQKAIASAGYARASMDNAMFGPNDLSLFVGLGLAYVKDGWTFQAEATIFYLARTKGGAAQRDEVKANTTWAAHAGYYLLPQLSIGAELRYQDFIAPPKAIQRTPQRRDAATAAIGLRWHLAIGQHALHPGVSYAHPLDDPMAKAGYRIVQLDVPFVF